MELLMDRYTLSCPKESRTSWIIYTDNFSTGSTYMYIGYPMESYMYIKAFGHGIRADCLLNLKLDAIVPHLPTQ